MKYHPKRYVDKKFRTKDPIGYCWCFTHRGYLNVKLLKGHECLEKNCSFLQKYQNHPYWDELKNIEEKKRQRKEDKKRRKELERMENSIPSELSESITEIEDEILQEANIDEISNDISSIIDDFSIENKSPQDVNIVIST